MPASFEISIKLVVCMSGGTVLTAASKPTKLHIRTRAYVHVLEVKKLPEECVCVSAIASKVSLGNKVRLYLVYM